MNVEAEIRDLKRRVSELEGSFGFLTEQVKVVHKDLLAFEAKTEQRFNGLENKVDGLENKVDGLIKVLPGIVGDAVREANRERDTKR